MLRSRLTATRFRLITALALLMFIGFGRLAWFNCQSAEQAIRHSIINDELPLSADSIYAAIHNDLVQPLVIASMMAHDSAIRDWANNDEHNPAQISRYLQEIKGNHGAFDPFFVSEQSRNYYYPGGLLKQVKAGDKQDEWFFRLRELHAPYEINVDTDSLNTERISLFINYRVLDAEQRFIGATGIGLPLETLKRRIAEYETRYDRNLLLVDAQGQVIVAGRSSARARNLNDIDGLKEQAASLLAARSSSAQYRVGHHNHYATSRYLAELQWHLLIIKSDSSAMAELRRICTINLFGSLLITMLVLWLVQHAIDRYQARLEHLSTTDPLTGMSNRRALTLLLKQAAREARRQSTPLTLLLIDIDHFKQVNERIGQLGGDQILRQIGHCLSLNLRKSDIICRWGGEEFLIVLKQTSIAGAQQVAEHLRQQIENLPLSHEETQIQVRISIGIALYRHNEPLDNLIARADSRLYRAKLEGRNRVCADLGDEAFISDAP